MMIVFAVIYPYGWDYIMFRIALEMEEKGMEAISQYFR
jgi:hypothetical protein